MSSKRQYTPDELGHNDLLAPKTLFVREVIQNGKQHFAEIDQSVKMYLTAFNRKRRSKLKPRAKCLLLWCMSECNERCDQVTINVKAYMKENNVNSINTYKAALLELIEANILAETLIPNVFYFDHTMFFKGSRANALNLNVIFPY